MMDELKALNANDGHNDDIEEMLNEKNDRILTVESLLYGPTAKKRNVVLEMEAMMRSIKL